MSLAICPLERRVGVRALRGSRNAFSVVTVFVFLSPPRAARETKRIQVDRLDIKYCTLYMRVFRPAPPKNTWRRSVHPYTAESCSASSAASPGKTGAEVSARTKG